MHGGCTPTGLVATGSCLADLPRLRRARLLLSVAVGEADETLNGGPPLVDLVCHWRVIQEQLSSSQRFFWSLRWRRRTVRGAGYARTPNWVGRSSILSRRPCLARASMLACMLVSNVPRSTSLALLQREHGARSTGALSTLHLLGRVWCLHGRRRLRGLVFGPGDDVSPTVSARSFTGVHSTARLLRRWW